MDDVYESFSYTGRIMDELLTWCKLQKSKSNK